MRPFRPLWTAVIVIVLVLLHYTLRPFLGWRVQVDFLVVALLLVAVRSRPAVAAVTGLVVGIVTDSATPDAFGAGALAMTVIGFAASWLKAAFFTENIALNGMFVFAGKWAFDIVYVLASRRMHGADLAAQLLWWSPLAALITGLAGVAILVWTQPAQERRR
jgi:rod shape-determining protein MreD